jgi:hypothetical protein
MFVQLVVSSIVVAAWPFDEKAAYQLPKDYIPFEVAAKYAAATYCTTIFETQTFECGPRCEGSANGTVLEYTIIEPESGSRGMVSYNTNLNAIFVNFKGIETVGEVFKGAQFWKSSLSLDDWLDNEDLDTIKIHAGFAKLYEFYRPTIIAPILKLARRYPTYKIVFSGHSMGGALALICAVDYYELFMESDRIFVYTFGKPRVGNKRWADHVNNLPFTNRIFRVVTEGDIIAQLPFRSMGYEHEKQIYLLLDDGTIYKCPNDSDGGESLECSLPLYKLNQIAHLKYWDIGSKANACNSEQ